MHERIYAFMQKRSKLIEARKALGFTQNDLAELTGIPQGTISRTENGVHSPTLEHARVLCEALGVGLDAFDVDSPDTTRAA